MLQKPCVFLALAYISHTNWQLGDRPILPHGFDVINYSLVIGNKWIQFDEQSFDDKLASHNSLIDYEKSHKSMTSLDNEVIVDTLNIYKEK